MHGAITELPVHGVYLDCELLMQAIDYLIITAYFITILLVGRWHARRNKSADDFLLGGRRMGSLPVGLSLFVSWFSVISYTAIPGEIIQHGPWLWTGMLAAPVVLWFVGWRVIPRMRGEE